MVVTGAGGEGGGGEKAKVEARAGFVSQAGEVWILACPSWETWAGLAIAKCKAGCWLPYSIPSVLGGRCYYDYPCFMEEETETQRG